MGGIGSGRRSRRKITVEECLVLDILPLSHAGVFDGAEEREGFISWTDEATEQVLDLVIFSVQSGTEPAFTLELKDQSGVYRQSIEIEKTYPHFGGQRFWFRCPLHQKRGEPGGLLSEKLYRPPDEPLFGCRACYHLTYASAQGHDSRVDRLRKNPDLVADMFDEIETSAYISSRLSKARLLIKVLVRRMAEGK